jgi:RNA polymerase sigma-70 factor (ECF subfamily)
VPREPKHTSAPPDDTAASRATATEDLRLVSAFRSGEPGALAALLARYQDRLFNLCLRMVADREAAADLAQDAMVKVIQGLHSFDGRSALSTWVVRIAMNVCLSYLRAQRLRRHVSLDASPSRTSVPIPGTDAARDRGSLPGGPAGHVGEGRELPPAESVELKEQRARVAAALGALPPEQRSIIVLRDIQGLDYEQIAAVLDLAVGTVKSRLFRARLALREVVEGTGSPSGASPSSA